MSLSPRLVLTAQEHLQPFSFRESEEGTVNIMCTEKTSSPVTHVYGALRWFGGSDGGERTWREDMERGKEGGEEHHTSPPFGACCHMNVKAPEQEKRNPAMSSKGREGPHTGCLRSRKAITPVLSGDRQLWIEFIHI